MDQKKENKGGSGGTTLSECRERLKSIKESNQESKEELKDILKQLK